MLFTIELLGGYRQSNFRLQKDGTWRTLEKDGPLLESDFRASDPSDVTNRTPYGSDIEGDGITYGFIPEAGIFFVRVSSTVYRRDCPDVIPSKEQLRAVLASGDNGKTDSLILNLQGHFELRQRLPFDIHKNDPTVIVHLQLRFGCEAAAKEIDEIFMSFMEGWRVHLKTGETQQFSAPSPPISYEQLLEEVESLKSHWVPGY